MLKINFTNKIYYVILTISLFIGLFFGEDSAGSGGFRLDFSTTWGLVEQPFRSDLTKYDIKFPLHYYIASFIYLILDDKNLLRTTYCIIAATIPFIFYKCLKKKFKNTDINNLFLFSLIIFLLPSFRAAAIWPNTQITGILFFLIAIFFYLSWENKRQFNKINKELFLTIFFMSLTVYTRQIYALVFFYILFEFFIRMKTKTLIKTCFLIFLFSLPGFAYIYYWPRILQATFDYKLYNTLLINSSIISFYLIPFFLILEKFKIKKIFFNNQSFLILIISIAIVAICAIFFDYNFKMGGGFFIKLSVLLFNNLSLFFITSVIGLYLLCILSLKNKMNILLSIIILFSISAWIIFQKYFEPMFLLLLFFFYRTNLTKSFLKSKLNICLFHIYFIVYLFSAIVNDILQLTKNI
ncbi:hypothetical protein OAL70_02335 [Pelagibacteraceae bacterium]|nr:hypothetical protein [Pelagibacteraceae bacterium]